MVTKTITEQRAEVRIFAGNDPPQAAAGFPRQHRH